MVQSVVGHKSWHKSRSKLLISEAMTISQEATALWILKNYENKWDNLSSDDARFTGSTRGNRKFHGWSSEGIAEYNAITMHVKNDRNNGHAFEEEFRDAQMEKLFRAQNKHNDSETHEYHINLSVSCYDDLMDVPDMDEIDTTQLENDEQSLITEDNSTPVKALMYPPLDNLITDNNYIGI